MKQQSFKSHTNRSSINVVNSVIKDLISSSKTQARQNKLVSKCMNPYTSQKVNLTMNQIGHLIYEEADDSSLTKRFDHFVEVDSPKYFQKDNMFTNGVLVDYEENQEDSRLKRDDCQSVNSFKTSLSKLPVHASSIDNGQTTSDNAKQQNYLPPKKQQSNPSNSKLISLQPQTSSQNRTSAFTQSHLQNLSQKNIEIQINQFRDQKLLEEQTRKKTMEKDKKLTHLITNDQVIMTFDYNGDFIKKTKRELAQMINGKYNQPIAETALLIKDPEKFWKSKNNKNRQRTFNESSSSFILNESQINQLKNRSIKIKTPAKKRTTMEKIEELKKRSILVELKKKIVISQQRPKNSDKKGFHLNSMLTTGIDMKKLTQEEQAKIKENNREFLSKNLHYYHQKEQNFMPEWVQKVEKGCKMTIFIGDGQDEKAHERQRQRQMEKKANQSLSDRSERSTKKKEKQQKERLGSKKGKENGALGNLHEVKQLQNLKAGQLTQSEIIEEWQKRIHIKSVDHKLNAVKARKSSSNLKNSRALSVQDGKEISRNNTNNNCALQGQGESRVNISKEIDNPNDKTSELKASQKSIKPDQYDMNQDDTKSQYSFSNSQKTKLNLNKKQFEKLKKYLKNKNSIVTRNETLKNDNMEFFMMSGKKPSKQTEILNKSENKLSVSAINHSVQISSHVYTKQKQNENPINEEEEESTINQKKISQRHRRLLTLAWKPRSFSVNDRRSSPCKSEKKPKNKEKLQGSIKINNQKLKHSLLRQSMDFDLSNSSILNTNQRSKSKLKSSSSQIKWDLTQKSRLKSIIQSQKRLLPIESNTKSLKYIENPESINLREVNLLSIAGKQTPKTQSTSIVINKPRTSVARTNFLKNVVN